jgi:hypothetical protein
LNTGQYDIIGDIHGYADKLHALLEKLGYTEGMGAYSHPKRKVIFLGDFIDRGPQQQEVLDTVMAMVKGRHAHAVMGNHEFNALAYHTPDPNDSNAFLRPHLAKNTRQHQAFIDVYGTDTTDPKLKSVLDFFYSLPLWLEIYGLRIVHACWHPKSITFISDLLSTDNTLTHELLVAASREGTPAFEAVETLLKGIETTLPHLGSFIDKDGTQRKKVRLAWWSEQPVLWSQATVPPNIISGPIADQLVPSDLELGYSAGSPPVLFGHYWHSGPPKPLRPNAACLDFSVAKGGKLCAYRWSGEHELCQSNFIYV